MDSFCLPRNDKSEDLPNDEVRIGSSRVGLLTDRYQLVFVWQALLVEWIVNEPSRRLNPVRKFNWGMRVFRLGKLVGFVESASCQNGDER